MRISVIIPTLNEALFVGDAVNRAITAGADEIIVADGNSTDGTAEKLSSLDCRRATSKPGRGNQLNAGAAIATGDVYLFLHVDNYLDAGGCAQIREAISDNPAIRCGAFRQRITCDRLIYRCIEFGNAQRITWLGMAYGDQGIFVHRDFFQETGGFEPIPLMEDFQFSRRVRSLGEKYHLCAGPLHVSSRRWESSGPIRQTAANWLTAMRYLLGADANQLAERY